MNLKRHVDRLLSRRAWSRKTARGIRVCDFDGVKVHLDLSEHTHRTFHQRGYFEPQLTQALGRTIQPGEVFVDIGANFGWHTLALLVKRADIPFVYSFEPCSKAFRLLQAGVVENRVQNRCFPQRIAVGKADGKANLKIFSDLGSVNSSLYPLADWLYEEEEVQVRPLDSLVSDFAAPPSVIKCDVEGGELDVLLGAKDILSGAHGAPPMWFLEANYETAGMAGFFPWELIELASQFSPYRGFFIRESRIVPLPGRTSLRHGDILVLAIPECHGGRIG